MKKGTKISKIMIVGDHVSVYDNNGNEVKLTRAQRQIMKKYNHWDFEDKVFDEFSANVLDVNYCVIKDGEVVFKKD